MAKKKKRKEVKKQDNGYQQELIGFLLIIIAIMGFLPTTGIVGDFIKSFSAFLAGTWYNLVLLAVFIVGIYMMIKREKPEFFTAKLVGLYVFLLGILVWSHVSYIENTELKGFAIITETITNFMTSITSKLNLGGGIIGAIFSTIFMYLFSINGTKIIIWALIVCGIMMFTGMSFVTLTKKIIASVKNKKQNKKEKKDKEEIKKVEEQFDQNNKKVVSSVDELIHLNEDIKPKEEVIEPKEEVEDNKGYIYPPINLLNKNTKSKNVESKETINHNVDVLHQVFKDFGLEGHVVAINPGPTVTQYEMEIKSGTRLSKVSSIHSEIALALAAKDVRIQAPIPGKSTIGIEIPNKVTAMVTVREILELIPKSMNESKLMVALGRDIMGRPQYCEINKTPHLLVAGSTGSGKSVCINSMIVSILMRAKPDEVKLVLVDTKKF